MATTQIKNGYHGGSDDQLLVNPDGSINVNTSGGGGGNASVGPTGATAPTSATEIAGINPEGKLTAVTVDDNGFVNVRGVSSEAGLNTFSTSQYSIGTSPVQLAPVPLANRSSVSIAVSAAPNVPVYIGNSSGVTVNNGYPLYDGSSLQLDITGDSQLWAVSTVASQTIALLEIA